MEHIRQFDWCYSQPDYYFVKEDDIANSATEKILRNKFRDPLISSDSDDEKPNIDWNEVFSSTLNNRRVARCYVPGIHPIPPYPKISAMTRQQHYQCLKVLCSRSPHILESEFMARPTKNDYRLFEDIKDIYEKEQKEYVEWAKGMWTNGHCIRALRPKPPVETVYEARFKMRITELHSYPKKYGLAAQIPLETNNILCEMVHVKDLINVNVKELPEIKFNHSTRMTIMKHCSVPEPCARHPCRFILPTESSVSELPLTEIQRELGQYAVDNDAEFIASESALRCLVELDQPWHITVNVCSVFGLDGETYNVVVLGSDFSTARENVLLRSYRSFKHLLEYTLVPTSEKKKFLVNNTQTDTQTDTPDTSNEHAHADDMDVSSDDEDALLLIDETAVREDSEIEDSETSERPKEIQKENREQPVVKQTNKTKASEFYSCSCKDTFFEKPPPRSYKKWQIRNKSTGENLDIVVHCPHKVRDDSGEVVLEPVPEYQLDLGASSPSPDHQRMLALALRLRPNAALLTVRIDNASGELVTYERTKGELAPQNGQDFEAAVTARLLAALAQLRGLRPDYYVLHHEPSHGANAMLYVAQIAGSDLVLDFDSIVPPDGDEANDVKRAPTISTALLPVHKFRKILPCTFSYYENQVRPPRVPPNRNRTPPQALKWPKRRRKRKAKN